MVLFDSIILSDFLKNDQLSNFDKLIKNFIENYTTNKAALEAINISDREVTVCLFSKNKIELNSYTLTFQLDDSTVTNSLINGQIIYDTLSQGYLVNINITALVGLHFFNADEVLISKDYFFEEEEN